MVSIKWNAPFVLANEDIVIVNSSVILGKSSIVEYSIKSLIKCRLMPNVKKETICFFANAETLFLFLSGNRANSRHIRCCQAGIDLC